MTSCSVLFRGATWCVQCCFLVLPGVFSVVSWCYLVCSVLFPGATWCVQCCFVVLPGVFSVVSWCSCFVARLYSRQKKYAVAAEKYDKAIELMEKVYGRDSLRLIAVLHEYGKVMNHTKVLKSLQIGGEHKGNERCT